MESLSSKPAGKWECSHAKPCTALLDDPETVLNDHSRWPDRICWPVMVESCRRWAVENDPERAGEYPLPLPDGHRALLALRVRRGRSTLDLFGLEGYKPRITDKERRYAEYYMDPDDYVWLGGPMACVLSAVGSTPLFELAGQAQKWWQRVSLRPPRGRPRGSGAFESNKNFLRAVAVANRKLREQDKTITQPEVADVLHIGVRRLQQLIPHGMTWDDLKKL